MSKVGLMSLENFPELKELKRVRNINIYILNIFYLSAYNQR